MLFPQNFITFFAVQWFITYSFRMLISSYRKLVLNDYFYIFSSALLTSLVSTLGYDFLNLLLFFLFTVLMFVQWVNGITFKFYGIKLNFYVLKSYSSEIFNFRHEFVSIFPELYKNNKFGMFPLFGLLLYAGYFLVPYPNNVYLFALFFVYFLTVITKSKIDIKTFGFWLLAETIISSGLYFIPLFFWHKLATFSTVYFVLVAIIFSVLAIIKLTQRKKNSPFYTLKTMLFYQFQDERLPSNILLNPPELLDVDAKLVSCIPHSFVASSSYNSCQNASIILITVESLSGYYLREPHLRERYMPFYSRLSQHSINSQCHISPSSLTNNMHKSVYTGRYNDFSISHLRHLESSGYQSCFITSARSTEFGMDKLLAKIGFNHIVDNQMLSNKKIRLPDNVFFDRAFEKVTDRINFQKPFFLHIMNNQTHGPYFTYEKKILDRKERYYQAILESDKTIEKFVNRLQEQYDLQNAIIQPQIEVPFLLSHPNLNKADVSMSNHFDIFPTLFDLIGQPYNYTVLGQSLFNPTKNEHCLVYSETRTGNTPSSFGLITPNRKIYFDRQMNNYQISNLNDEVLEVLTDK